VLQKNGLLTRNLKGSPKQVGSEKSNEIRITPIFV
jgi:hypothetical protein